MYHCDVVVYCVVFFFKQKTAYEMRISDWSADVCSSDLSSRAGDAVREPPEIALRVASPARWTASARRSDEPHRRFRSSSPANGTGNPHGSGSPHLGIRLVRPPGEIGRASCRERVCKSV